MKITKRILLPLQLFILAIISLIYVTRISVEPIIRIVPPTTPSSNYQAAIIPLNVVDKTMLGAGSAVAVDSQGDILYLHRAGYEFNNTEHIPYPTVIRIEAKTNKILAQWGADHFKSPHGLAVDSQDNIWITDVMLNKVFKFSADGQLLQTYGDDYPFYLEACLRIRNKLPQLPCTQNPYLFARPTDIVINESGEFIITDGYRNSRLIKFNAEGQMLWQTDRLGNEDGAFYLPHGLAMDERGNLYVADRKNARIQVFSQAGEWLATWDQPELGRPYGLEVGPDQFLYVVDGGDSLTLPDGTGERRSQIIKMALDGTMIERWGTIGQAPGQMDLPHDIAVDNNGIIYVAEINNERLQIFISKKTPLLKQNF